MSFADALELETGIARMKHPTTDMTELVERDFVINWLRSKGKKRRLLAKENAKAGQFNMAMMNEIRAEYANSLANSFQATAGGK